MALTYYINLYIQRFPLHIATKKIDKFEKKTCMEKYEK